LFTLLGILAALTANRQALKNTLQLAFCHLFFNITGILLFYPIPWMRFPIRLAKLMGNTTAKYRWFSFLYLILMFFVLPTSVFLLSMAGTWVFSVVGGLGVLIIVSSIIINIIQTKRPSLLPLKLQTWNWLPFWMHSLDPLDSFIMKLGERFTCLACCTQSQTRHDALALGLRSNQSQIHILEASKYCSASENHLTHAYDDVAFVRLNGVKSSEIRIKNSQV
jgi:Na/Pi-cotransporter, putative